MSRQMKFRFWDKLYSKMSDPISMRHLATEHRAYKDEYIEWLQWTGLQDKNGQDIYEGDILQSENSAFYIHHQVVWSSGFMGWQMLNLKSGDPQDGSPQLFVGAKNRKIEVIGNIYANPELINPIQESTTNE